MLTARLPAPMVTTDTARTAYDRVLAGAGATVPMRDQADTLLVSQVRAQTGILIQSEQDLVSLGVGDSGYGTLPAATRPAGFDTDRDGMPDAWETANGLNPSDAADRNGDADARRLHEPRGVSELAGAVIWSLAIRLKGSQGYGEEPSASRRDSAPANCGIDGTDDRIADAGERAGGGVDAEHDDRARPLVGDQQVAAARLHAEVARRAHHAAAGLVADGWSGGRWSRRRGTSRWLLLVRFDRVDEVPRRVHDDVRGRGLGDAGRDGAQRLRHRQQAGGRVVEVRRRSCR